MSAFQHSISVPVVSFYVTFFTEILKQIFQLQQYLVSLLLWLCFVTYCAFIVFDDSPS